MVARHVYVRHFPRVMYDQGWLAKALCMPDCRAHVPEVGTRIANVGGGCVIEEDARESNIRVVPPSIYCNLFAHRGVIAVSVVQVDVPDGFDVGEFVEALDRVDVDACWPCSFRGTVVDGEDDGEVVFGVFDKTAMVRLCAVALARDGGTHAL